MGYGPMLFAGYAQPATSTTNVTVMWPSIELLDGIYRQSLGTVTWDILVTVGQSAVTPYGTGSFALATNAGVSCGTNGMCSFTDTQAAPVSYTVQAQQFTPVFWFWPNNFILNNTTVFVDVAGYDPMAVASQGSTGVSIVAAQCEPGGVVRRRTPIWVSCMTSSSSYGTQNMGTVLQELDPSNNGPFVNSKGRLNFGKTVGTPNDLITLTDSNFGKTIATAGQRPPNDAGDVALGVDQNGGLSQRAGTSISSYINVVPNGTNFLERLTAAGKTVNVPLTLNGNLTVSTGTVSLPVTGAGPQCLHVSATGVVSGTGADCGSGSGSGGSDPVTVNSGVSSQVAMYSGNGSAVNGDSTLMDNGTTLNYSGTGGIATTSGTFSGNLAVNGQLEVAGPWMVSSPIPGTLMSASGPGTSSLGISDDGNFYVSANGGTPEKVATSATSSYFTNLWQEDANDVGSANGTNAQGLHVYSNYANSSSWQRTSLGYDTTDNLSVLKSENSTPTSAPGLGFWIGSSVRWAINSASELKPFANNSFNIGDASFAPQTIYAATSFDTLTGGRQNFELCNDGTTGTMQNFLAVYNGATPECAVQAGISTPDGVIGVVSNGSGKTGNAVITYQGYALCSFDGPTAAGDYVIASTTNPGDCHDPLSAGRPTAVQVLGRVESTNAALGTYGMRVSLDAPVGSGGSLNSPTFTGTVTLPDGTTDSSSGIALGSAVTLPNGSTAATTPSTDSSMKVATTAYVQAQGYTSLAAANEGTTLANSSNGGSGRTYSAIAYEFHSTGFPAGTTLKTMLASCPAAGTDCRLVLDPSSTAINVGGNVSTDYPVIIGTGTSTSTWQHVTVENRGVPLNCAYTGGGAAAATLDCIQIGEWGAMVGASPGNSLANGGGAIITSSTGATYRSLVSNAGVQSGAYTPAGYQNYLQQRMRYEGVSILPQAAGGTSITQGLLSVIAVEGQGYFGHFSVGALNNTTNVYVADGPTSGDNNSLLFDDISNTCFNFAGCVPLNLESSAHNGNGINITFHEVGFGNGPGGSGCHSGAGCMLNIDGSAVGTNASGYLANLLFDGAYIEMSGTYPAWVASTAYSLGNSILQGSTYFSATTAGTSGASAPSWASCSTTCSDGTVTWTNEGSNNPSHYIEITNARDVDIRGLNFNAGSVGTCITMGHAASTYLGRIHLTGRVGSGHCTTLLNNTVSGYTISGTTPTDLDYTYAGEQPNGGIVIDGAAGLTAATATTPASMDNSTKVATTAYVQAQGYAPAASPALTGTPTAPTASAGDNSTKVATTAYVRSEQYLTFSCPVGSVGTVEQFCTWTLPAAVTITGFDISAGTAPASCSTYPTVQVWDGTANAEVGNFSISMTNGNNFYTQVPGSANVASGHALRIKTTTGQLGCATGGANVVAVVSYQMQN